MRGCAASPRSCSSSSSRCRPHNAPSYPLEPLSLTLNPNPHTNSQDRSRRGSKDRNSNSSRESSQHVPEAASGGEGSGRTAYLDSSPSTPSGSEAHNVLAVAATAANSAAAASPRTAAKPAAVARQRSAGSGLAAAMEEIDQEASRNPRVRAG